ncbi:MAG: molybdopterin-guanine dinucleotide biosynthesis protein B [Acidobacteria bacterium]|nr:molybdopterin-guanine dinucleotide biosynthesis protein B [Acidobacteriota bacterium]
MLNPDPGLHDAKRQTTGLCDLPAFGVCGWSGSGKTTLIEAVVPPLCKKGLKVAVLKRTTHPIAADRHGKDSDRFFRAGADVLLQGPDQGLFRMQGSRDADLGSSLRSLSTRYDLILVESYKEYPVTQLWLADPSQNPAPERVQGIMATLPRNSDRVQSLLAILEAWLPRQWRKPPVFGCVLIGGKSRRMGYPKHLIETNGKTWIQRTVEVLVPLTSQVVVAGGTSEMSKAVHLADVPDVHGPMAGVLSAMRWAPHASWLVVACDLPLLSGPALEWLLSTRSPGVWATLPQFKGSGRRLESLLAHYDYRARQLIEDLATQDEFSLSQLGSHQKVITPDPPLALAPAWQDVDTPAQLEQVG